MRVLSLKLYQRTVCSSHLCLEVFQNLNDVILDAFLKVDNETGEMEHRNDTIRVTKESPIEQY